MRTENLDKRLQRLSKGTTGRILRETLEEVCRIVADVRTPLTQNVKPEIQNEVRLGVIDCIESFLLAKIRIYSGDNDPQDVHEFE